MLLAEPANREVRRKKKVDLSLKSNVFRNGLLDVKVRFFFSLFYIFRDLYITLRKQKRNHISKEISLF